MWDEDEEGDDGKQKTPKQRLLGWIQNKLPELPITNFSRDWQSGRALGALVDSCAPGLCVCLFVCVFVCVSPRGTCECVSPTAIVKLSVLVLLDEGVGGM